MVVSIAYMLNELEAKMKSTGGMDKIAKTLENLEEQALRLEDEIDEEVAILIDTLQRRKNGLKDTLWKIVSQEDRSLDKQRAQISEFSELFDSVKAQADSRQFRKLYGEAMERYDAADFLPEAMELNLYADRQQMNDAIARFGTICLEVGGKTGEDAHVERFPGEMHSEDFFGLKNESDDFDIICGDLPRLNKNDSCCEETEDGSEFACEFSGCCNCVDLCEEKGLPLSNQNAMPKSSEERLQGWLIKPKSSTIFHDESEVMEDSLFDNKLVNQLKALKIQQREEVQDGKKQAKFSAEFLQGLQSWLISKQRTTAEENQSKREAMVAGDLMEFSESKQGTSIAKTWDEIMAQPTSTWLRNYGKGIHEDVGRASPNIDGYVEIQSSPLDSWLRKDLSRDLERGIGKMPPSHSMWLKRKYNGSGFQTSSDKETETTRACKKIKSKPLDCWLKRDKSSFDATSWKAPKLEEKEQMDICDSKTTNTIKQFEDITTKPLEKWLRDAYVTEKGSSKDFDMFYAPQIIHQSLNSSSIPANSPSIPAQSRILAQFDAISACSDLSRWLKKPPPKRSPAPKKHDLCKWLRSGSMSGCESCSMSCESFTNDLI